MYYRSKFRLLTKISHFSYQKKIDIKAEHRRQFAFKGERKHVVKVNIPNIAQQSQHINIEILHCCRNHVIVSDTVILRLILTLNQQAKQVVL